MRIGLGATRLWVTWSDDEVAPEPGVPVDAELVDGQVLLVVGDSSPHHVSRYQRSDGVWVRRVDFIGKEPWMERYPMFLVTDAEMVNEVAEYWSVQLPRVFELAWPCHRKSRPMTLYEIEHGLRKRLESAKRHNMDLRCVLRELPDYARGVLPNWKEVLSDYV